VREARLIAPMGRPASAETGSGWSRRKSAADDGFTGIPTRTAASQQHSRKGKGKGEIDGRRERENRVVPSCGVRIRVIDASPTARPYFVPFDSALPVRLA